MNLEKGGGSLARTCYLDIIAHTDEKKKHASNDSEEEPPAETFCLLLLFISV
jgi:hypothetical protein